MIIGTDILLAVYVKGKHLSFQRGKRNTNPNTSLVKIEGVDDTNAAKYVFTSPLPNEPRPKKRRITFTERTSRNERETCSNKFGHSRFEDVG